MSKVIRKVDMFWTYQLARPLHRRCSVGAGGYAPGENFAGFVVPGNDCALRHRLFFLGGIVVNPWPPFPGV
jgi:hypothetical protein